MFTRPFHGFVARLRAAVDSDAAGLKQALAALLVSSAGDLIAGVTLGAISDTLALLPGLLVLVPAAIGMRGNIFGALGSRLGTSIHTGTFRLSRRRDTVVGQNVVASIALTLFVSAALAVLAKVVSSAFGAGETISLADFLVISVVGGVLGSVFVLGLTLLVAWLSVRRGWDMDNVAAPLVTAAGDMVTLPALYVATFLVGIKGVTVVLAGACVVVAVGSLLWTIRLRLPIVGRILRESIPVLLVAGTVDLVAGLTIENRLESFLAYPALLVLVPPFLEDTGALGSVLSSRLASKLHLGIIEPTARPQRPARRRLRHHRHAGDPRVRAGGAVVPGGGHADGPGQPGRGQHGGHLAHWWLPGHLLRCCSWPTTAASPPTASGSTPTTTACRCSPRPWTWSAPSR